MSHLKDAEEEAEGDMTPMIDAVFLLIIFFLCIDFKVLEAKVPAFLPTDKGSASTPEEPVEQLSIRIVCEVVGTEKIRYPNQDVSDIDGRVKARPYALIGHKIYWTIGPKKIDTLEELKEILTDIAEDPNQRVPDKDNPGQTKLKPVVIEPQENVTYGDVATTVDVVQGADFSEINFGGNREGL